MNKTKTSQLRKKHNEDLIHRMKQGESLQSQSASDSWFPPRPVIKKNSAALRELYVAEELDNHVPANASVASEIKKPNHLRLA